MLLFVLPVVFAFIGGLLLHRSMTCDHFPILKRCAGYSAGVLLIGVAVAMIASGTYSLLPTQFDVTVHPEVLRMPSWPSLHWSVWRNFGIMTH